MRQSSVTSATCAKSPLLLASYSVSLVPDVRSDQSHFSARGKSFLSPDSHFIKDLQRKSIHLLDLLPGTSFEDAFGELDANLGCPGSGL